MEYYLQLYGKRIRAPIFRSFFRWAAAGALAVDPLGAVPALLGAEDGAVGGVQPVRGGAGAVRLEVAGRGGCKRGEKFIGLVLVLLQVRVRKTF